LRCNNKLCPPFFFSQEMVVFNIRI
jgi:hypothetical protein